MSQRTTSPATDLEAMGLTGTDLDLGVRAAAARLAGTIETTPLVPFDSGDVRVELRLKLECEQVTGAFKARGALNQIALLDDAARAAGVVTCSSGNHGRALAWAAKRAGIKATIVMPADAYPNKIEAVRAEGAEVVLAEGRVAAEAVRAELAAAGAHYVPPYDALGTLEGQGTVALEVLEQWPECELLVSPVGGGGLLAGCALAFAGDAARGGPKRWVIGVEPAAAATMAAALDAGHPVQLDTTGSVIQGLTSPNAGELPRAIAQEHVTAMADLTDEEILAAQKRLVREAGLTVEPAGAAAVGFVLLAGIPAELLEGRDGENPLRVVAIVSGGNADPVQLASIREG
ncbi:threonine ammonia-lyase [Engelhardtia mirabilis]|uniref:Phenylserine dehydratase n=1 Tax=Engelhardtia mirabilis TaxID=2528011 RepID=A0A518BR43_9BACT|nr:Phenylserine dehydratase [Planctomycetes bacterium Pla133]QDV03774.1 Phenylserine dehydratase [Planctomycetes bacterium Pla86]